MCLTAYRRITQVSFIILVFLLPVFDILRYDSATRELIVFGHVWNLGDERGSAHPQGKTYREAFGGTIRSQKIKKI